MIVQPSLLLKIITSIVTFIDIIVIVIKPFCAEDSLHTSASMSVVVKSPFYTWRPDYHNILHLDHQKNYTYIDHQNI